MLWWCYQESQQRRQQAEQWEQSQSQLRTARHKRRAEIQELHVLEAKMIHEGVDPKELNLLHVVDPIEEKELYEMLEKDLEAERVLRRKAELRMSKSARLLTRKTSLQKIHTRDKQGMVQPKKNKNKNTITSKSIKNQKTTTTATSTTKNRITHTVHPVKHLEELDPEYKRHELLNSMVANTLEETIDDVLSAILTRFWWAEVASDVRRYCSQFTLEDAPAEIKTFSDFVHRSHINTNPNYNLQNQNKGGAHDAHRQLYLASTRNDLDEMKRLIEHEGAGVFARGTELGETAIHHAIRHCNFEMLQ